MWDMRRSLDLRPLPPKRTTIHFMFPELVSAKRSWWLVIDGGKIDLCQTNPGFDVDLYVKSSLRSMTAVWMGMTTVKKEMAAGHMELIGDKQIAQSMQQWLGLSPFAKEKSARLRLDSALPSVCLRGGLPLALSHVLEGAALELPHRRAADHHDEPVAARLQALTLEALAAQVSAGRTRRRRPCPRPLCRATSIGCEGTSNIRKPRPMTVGAVLQAMPTYTSCVMPVRSGLAIAGDGDIDAGQPAPRLVLDDYLELVALARL